MCEVGLKKLEQPDFTASARAGVPSLIIMSEGLVPETYWVPQPPKLDRQALLTDLKRCAEVPRHSAQQPPTYSCCEDKVMAFTEAQVKNLQLFAIWERNVDTVRAINKHTTRSTPRGAIAQNLVAHMKARAIALAKQGGEPTAQRRTPSKNR